jgi:hypothetical protein
MTLPWNKQLADIRAEMALLALRQARLTQEPEEKPAMPVFRPGWPIQRSGAVRSVAVWQRG